MCKQKAKGNGVCRHCGFIGSTTMLIREHDSNCKFNPKNKEQMTNQETLEEAAKKHSSKFANIKVLTNELEDREVMCEESFEQGSKWQSERMYSEEDMIEFHKWAYQKNRIEECDKTTKELLKEWFEQFKKK
jgi:hypothetical protein